MWILEHLREADFHLRKKTLLWVAMALRPITVHEMALAFATPDDQETFDPAENIMATAEDILIACGPLIEITPKDTLQFTHFSVKEFLLGHGYNHDSLGQGQDAVRQCLILDVAAAHDAILQTCSKYCFEPISDNNYFKL